MDKRIIAIAKKLKQLRKNKGYTSYENFAWDNEIPRVQYWRMEKGTNFTIRTFLRVLDAHNLTLKEFLRIYKSLKVLY
jgi:predicted transcriptional regulator